jgi:hypothetical protein
MISCLLLSSTVVLRTTGPEIVIELFLRVSEEAANDRSEPAFFPRRLLFGLGLSYGSGPLGEAGKSGTARNFTS